MLGANYALKAQVMQGKAPGRYPEASGAWISRLPGYVEVNWQVLPILGVLARGEIRDAIVTLRHGSPLPHESRPGSQAVSASSSTHTWS